MLWHYRRSNKTLWMVPMVLAALQFSACSRGNEYVAPPPMSVTVSKPLQAPVTDFAEFTGNVEAFESVAIRARVEGYLEKICFTSGVHVKTGDLLFVIDPKPYQAKLDEARAELAQRQAACRHAEALVKRKELAFQANAVSEIEAIQARADFDVAKAAILGAKAAVVTAELNLTYTRVHAPINGRISRNLVDVGNLVGASERTLLANVVNDDPVYAYFNVNERDLIEYEQCKDRPDSITSRNGKAPVFLGLAGQDGYPFEGRIDYLDNRLDRSTGTIQVRGIFPNSDHRLWPGIFARIKVPLAKRECALLAPDAAIGKDQRGDFLLVVNSSNIVESRPVKTGSLAGDLRVIESGVSADERVVISGLQRARPGLAVNPSETQLSQPRAAPGENAD